MLCRATSLATALVLVILLVGAEGRITHASAQEPSAIQSQSELLEKISRQGKPGDPRHSYLVRWQRQMNFVATGQLPTKFARHIVREFRKIYSVLPFEPISDSKADVHVLVIGAPDIVEAVQGIYRKYFDAMYDNPEEAALAMQDLKRQKPGCYTRLRTRGEEIYKALSFFSWKTSEAEAYRCISQVLLSSYGVSTPNDEASIFNLPRAAEFSEITNWDLAALQALYAYEGELILDRRM
jgi:hypothetical protein